MKINSFLNKDSSIELVTKHIDGKGDCGRVVVSRGRGDYTIYLDAEQLAELGNEMIKLSKDLKDESEKVILKSIEYQGRVFDVPEEIKWVATDHSGIMWGFSSKPIQRVDEWVTKNNDKVVCLGAKNVHYYSDWENSLEELV